MTERKHTPEAIVLVALGDPEQKPRLYACQKCGSLHSPTIYAVKGEKAHTAAREAASNCYTCREHNICEGCGCDCPKGWTRCDSCRRKRVFDDAEKVDRATVDQCFGYDGTFYWDVAEAEAAGEPWVFVACPLRTFQLDYERILDSELEDHFEDASISDMEGVDDFIAAVEKFNAAQKSGTYDEDRKRIVVLSPEAQP